MNQALNVIDTEKFSAHLRGRGILPLEKKILVTNFRGSRQQEDFTVPANCDGFGRIRYALSRWEALGRYCDDGRIESDNNAAERTLREAQSRQSPLIGCGGVSST